MLIPVDKLPEGLEIVEQGKRVIVGHSESGHHHVAVCDSTNLAMLKPKGADSPDLYLEVSAPAYIEHLKPYDRHVTKPIAPGYYFVNPKMAYDYFLKRQVQVVD